MKDLMELNELVDQFNEGAKPLVAWMKKHMDDPFFETEDGKDVVGHMYMIAKGGALLNMKMSILLLQEVILERAAANNEEDS